jgi:hypothetical protein
MQVGIPPACGVAAAKRDKFTRWSGRFKENCVPSLIPPLGTHMKSFLLIASLLSTSAFAVTPNLVVNGSFESTHVNSGSYVYAPAIEGWSQLAASGDRFELRNHKVGDAQDGSNFIELDSTGNTTIGQSFATLAAGASYALSFWYAPRAGVAASSNGIEVLWNGQQLGSTITADGGSASGWTQYSFNVTALTGANTLSFRSVGANDSLGGALDNVSLTAAAPVPEPSSYALLLAGLGAVGMIARRRSAR